jgi:Zn-dependent peptidase ImmA (M78 family)
MTRHAASDIIHELAHVMLGHEPSQVVFSEDGQMATRVFDQKQEDEATWLGWALLLPRDALMAARRARLATTQIADQDGVSEKLGGFRLQMTGVDMQMRRRRFARGA